MSNDIKERLRNERRAFATWLNRWTDFDSGEIRAEGIQETIDTLSGALTHIEQLEQRIAELEAEVQMYKNKYIMQEVDLDEAEAEIRRLKQAEHENQ